MLTIPCPYCGNRPYTEFSYGGDASNPRPSDPMTSNDTDWTDYLYRHRNPAGPHIEYWQHANGCRRWMKVVRDTSTQQVLGAGDQAQAIEEAA